MLEVLGQFPTTDFEGFNVKAYNDSIGDAASGINSK
jgi:hypothetical protein